MRRLIHVILITLTLLAVLHTAAPSDAQETALNTTLVLSDTNPRVEVQLALQPGTQGVIRLELIDVTVSILNASSEQVLAANSSALREIEIRFDANSPAHIILVERLPKVATGYLRVSATSDMSLTGLTLNPAVVGLTPDHPQSVLPLDFSLAAAGVLELQQIENAAYTRLLLPDSTTILTLHSPAFDRVRVVLATGSYQLQMDNIAAYPTLQAQVETAAFAQAANLMQPVALTPTATSTCTGTVNFERVNQRSGAGVQYTITGEAVGGSVLPVGGWNSTKEWALVGTASGSAWMSAGYLNLAGDCANLPVY